MSTKNTKEIKEKIFNFLENNGPSLPVHIAKEMGLSILFASAFLSEILSEKKIKISHMRVGNSPLYFIPGQEDLLEKFSYVLKSKEKEAFLLLKEKNFLKDEDLDPPIRVALRAIRDFAIPFRHNEKIYWRYLTVPETEFNLEKKKPLPEKQEGKELNIFEKEEKTSDKKPQKKKKSKKTKKKTQTNNKFFNKVKEYLNNKQVGMWEIEEISNREIVLKVRENQKEYLIIAYNKKRVSEQEIIKARKKSEEFNLPYKIISLGTPLKRLKNLIDAIKTLESIDQIE